MHIDDIHSEILSLHKAEIQKEYAFLANRVIQKRREVIDLIGLLSKSLQIQKLTHGYTLSSNCMLTDTGFKFDDADLVIEKNSEIYIKKNNKILAHWAKSAFEGDSNIFQSLLEKLINSVDGFVKNMSAKLKKRKENQAKKLAEF